MKSLRKRIARLGAVAIIAAGTLTVTAPPASAHASCKGDSHSHLIFRPLQKDKIQRRHYDFVKVGKTGTTKEGRAWYENIYRIRELRINTSAICFGSQPRR